MLREMCSVAGDVMCCRKRDVLREMSSVVVDV